MCSPLFCSLKLHKIENYFIFEQEQKENWAIEKEKKFGSRIEIRYPGKTYPEYGVSKRHRISDSDPQHLELWRALDAHQRLKVEPWTDFVILLVADSHHFDEEQDPDPHQTESQIRIRITKKSLCPDPH
jgi:hypothetical protein